MAIPTAQEQLILELINRARLDPAAEAARLGIALNQDLAPGTIAATQKQVLAFDPLLNDAADGHSSWMLAQDVFAHTGDGGSDPGDRMAAAGYVFGGGWTWGENIAWSGTTGVLNPNATAAQLHDNLFRSAGHRTNILGGDFREIGIGAVAGQFTSRGTAYNAMMATENFALSGDTRFITGAVYNDADSDRFYSIGEGRGGVHVALAAVGAADTWAAGGYTLAAPASGTLRLAFSGGGLTAPAGAIVAAGAGNIKVDLVNGDTIQSTASTTISGAALNLALLGLNAANGAGSASANRLTGNKGANTLSGRDGNDVLDGGGGNDKLFGGAGADTFDFNASFGRDRVLDFEDGIDHLRFDPAIADHVSDFTITQTSATSATVALGANSVVVVGTSAFTLTAADFEFLA